jgi:2-C-methyl-D-erythritol 4-phosphate cytidylyltransferase
VSIVGIVPAGGSGERLGADRPKAFVALGGRAMLDWSVEVLSGACDRVVVAVPHGHECEPDRVTGGASRSASVRNALAAAPGAELVVIHDAARPLLTPDLVQRCIAAAREADGAIAAAPITDTVKEADPSGRIVRTLDRTSLWSIQTPQVFGADILRRALAVDDATLAAATDDASLVEAAGGTVVVVQAPAENLKVTTAGDLRRAEGILADRC